SPSATATSADTSPWSWTCRRSARFACCCANSSSERQAARSPPMNAPDRNGASGVFDAVDLGLILLDGDRRVPGRIPPRLETAISQALELGASSLVTHTLHPAMLPLRTPAGRQLVHNITVRPIGKRPALRCLLQILDVTVVAGRERILRERQNARYDAVVGSAPDTILTLDADGTIQFVNPATARQFGYSPDELIGRPLSSFLLNAQEWGT